MFPRVTEWRGKGAAEMRTFTLPQREKDELYIHLDLSLSLKGKVLNEATNFMHIWQLKGFCRFYITTRKSLRSNPYTP